MRARRTTRRLPITKRFVIPATRFCTRTPAFRAMNHQWARRGSQKKAAQRGPLTEREAAQSEAVAGPGESRTCASGREALAYRQRCAAQYPRDLLRLGNGGRMWLTQLARPGAQTQIENVTQ